MEVMPQNASHTASLELAFERSKDGLRQLYQQEQQRVLKVDLLLQQLSNDDLQEQLAYLQDVELKDSEDAVQDLQERLAEVTAQYEATQTELKTCLRDIEDYRTEITALNAASADRSKLLSEKLALSRELSTLRPEIEHLRSQLQSSDNALADKLSLQRELSAVQVELDMEKRTVERLKKKTCSEESSLAAELEQIREELVRKEKQILKFETQNSMKAADKSSADTALTAELESVKEQLEQSDRARIKAEKALRKAQQSAMNTEEQNSEIESLQIELAMVKKALQKAEREHLKQTTEWETERDSQESKLDAFRTKLRSTKDQLKEAQEEIERRDQSKFAESAAATKARMAGRAPRIEPSQPPAPNPRKRNVARFDPDMTIGTPGHGGLTKKPRITNVGDKSSFSITPFLNRTQSILPESPNAVINETINELAKEADKAQAEKADQEAKKTAAKKTVMKAKAQPLKDSKARSNVTKAPKLDKVVEEEAVEEAAEPVAVAAIQLTDATTLQPKKKKLLGARKNIFDDNEPDGIKKTDSLAHPKVRLGLGRNRPKMLAEFSPLKKDRRLTRTTNAASTMSSC